MCNFQDNTVPNSNKKPTDKTFEAIFNEASVLPGDARDINKPISEDQISCLNVDQIKEGQDFVRRNWLGVHIAHFISLILVMALKPGTAALLRTGQSHIKENSLVRYLSTLLHIRVWYEADFKKVVKDVQKVRRLHSKAFQTYYTTPLPKIAETEFTVENAKILAAVKADVRTVPGRHQIRDDLLVNNYEPKLPISQQAMAVTQFCFVGFVFLFPKIFGTHDLRGIDGFCHIWAVLGKMLGIEDRFNIGLQKNRDAMLRLYQEVFIPGLKNSDDLTMTLWDSVITACQSICPLCL